MRKRVQVHHKCTKMYASPQVHECAMYSEPNLMLSHDENQTELTILSLSNVIKLIIKSKERVI